MWGDAKSGLLPAQEGEAVVKPVRIGDLVNVECVKLSDTHIIVQCALPTEASKREAPSEEEAEAKKLKLQTIIL